MQMKTLAQFCKKSMFTDESLSWQQQQQNLINSQYIFLHNRQKGFFHKPDSPPQSSSQAPSPCHARTCVISWYLQRHHRTVKAWQVGHASYCQISFRSVFPHSWVGPLLKSKTAGLLFFTVRWLQLLPSSQCYFFCSSRYLRQLSFPASFSPFFCPVFVVFGKTLSATPRNDGPLCIVTGSRTLTVPCKYRSVLATRWFSDTVCFLASSQSKCDSQLIKQEALRECWPTGPASTHLISHLQSSSATLLPRNTCSDS